jgi:plasmid stabilization system protein ParE
VTRGSLRIHPAALEEAEAATGWYGQRSQRAAEMFLDELDRALEQIAGNPQHYPAYEFGTQRMVLRRFPFVVVFRVMAAGVEIIALAHGRRRPGYWRDRVE